MEVGSADCRKKVFVALSGKDTASCCNAEHSKELFIPPYQEFWDLWVKRKGRSLLVQFVSVLRRKSSVPAFRNCLHLSDHVRSGNLRSAGPPRFISSLPSSKPQWTPWLPCSIYDLLWYKKGKESLFLEMTFAHRWNAATGKLGPTNLNFYYSSNSLGNGAQFGCRHAINCLKLHSCSCAVSPGVCVPHKTVLKRTKDISSPLHVSLDGTTCML